MTAPALITAKGLRVRFESRRSDQTLALDNVSIQIRKGECLALVGESGSGKTTLGKTLLGLQKPSEGSVVLHIDGSDTVITALGPSELRNIWRHMQMVFQDPYAALNPRMTVAEIIGEPLKVRDLGRSQALATEIISMAELCGITRNQLSRYPHAFSGGQRQRIAIARALILKPAFMVCDEPVAALDVSIRAQIINLLKDLQEELGLSYLFITHDLSLVPHIADRIAVMKDGKIVEEGAVEQVMKQPNADYTKALLAAVPRIPGLMPA